MIRYYSVTVSQMSRTACIDTIRGIENNTMSTTLMYIYVFILMHDLFPYAHGSWAVGPGSGGQPIDGSQKIEYLNADGLCSFLRGSSKGTNGILQQFVESKVDSFILPVLRTLYICIDQTLLINHNINPDI